MTDGAGDEAIRALATGSALLVEPHDIAGTLVRMLGGIGAALDVEACGIVAAGMSGRFEVLSVSSHSTDDLALFESQTEAGPGVDASTRNEHVSVTGLEAVKDEWPELAVAMEESGFRSVLAAPLHWNDKSLGAAVVFRRGEVPFTSIEQVTLQAFADLSILVMIHTDPASVISAVQRVDEALGARTLIEQAKGVLAFTFSIDMAEAYELLQTIAIEAHLPLTAGARHVISQAMLPRKP